MSLYQKEPSKPITDEDKQHFEQIKARPSHSPFTPEEEDEIIEGGLKGAEPDGFGFVTLTLQSGEIPRVLYVVLDEIFGIRWDTARYQEKAQLIDKFEENYSRHKERVRCYKNIEGSIAAIRRLADLEREECRLASILDRSRINEPIADTDLWDHLRAEFQAIHDPLRASWDNEVGSEESLGKWSLLGPNGDVIDLFEDLATQAAVAVGFSSSEGLAAWCTLLRLHSPGSLAPTSLDRVSACITDLSERSADYCVVCKTKVIERKLALENKAQSQRLSTQYLIPESEKTQEDRHDKPTIDQCDETMREKRFPSWRVLERRFKEVGF